MIFISALLLVIICAYLIVLPQYALNEDHDNNRRELLSQKQRYLQMLKDLELDAKTKKISQEEFQTSWKQIAKELERIFKLSDSR